MELIIANKLYSSWSMRPWLAMRAAGLEFTESVIPLDLPETAARIKAVSPSGKLPALVDGDIRIWDSLAIIEYLNERFPDRGIWPAAPAARAHARSISAEMHSGFQPLRQACPMNLGKIFAAKEFPEPVRQDVERIEAIWREARSKFGYETGKPFLYGEFSAADAMYAPVVTRFATYQLPVAADTRAYMDAVLSHDAFRQWYRAARNESWSLPKYEVGHSPVDGAALISD